MCRLIALAATGTITWTDCERGWMNARSFRSLPLPSAHEVLMNSGLDHAPRAGMMEWHRQLSGVVPTRFLTPHARDQILGTRICCRLDPDVSALHDRTGTEGHCARKLVSVSGVWATGAVQSATSACPAALQGGRRTRAPGRTAINASSHARAAGTRTGG
jgi:hypothetical protein